MHITVTIVREKKTVCMGDGWCSSGEMCCYLPMAKFFLLPISFSLIHDCNTKEKSAKEPLEEAVLPRIYPFPGSG